MSKLYYHKTDGGAEYLCTSPVGGTDEGDLWTTIVRLDGEPELINCVYEAAPDLLKALSDLVAMCRMSEVRQAMMKHNQAYYHTAMYEANSAIRKAEGQ